MGRELKRVPLDFDWPINQIWPGYMSSICTDEIEYCIENIEGRLVTFCEACRHAGKLAGLKFNMANCPDWRIHPPTGEGYQLWENTTEGSPMSPVFETREELARWLANNNASVFGSKTATHEEWLRWLYGKPMGPRFEMDCENCGKRLTGVETKLTIDFKCECGYSFSNLKVARK